MRWLALAVACGGCGFAFDLERLPAPPDAADAPDASMLPPGLIAWYTMDAFTGDQLVDDALAHDGLCTACPGVTAGRLASGLAVAANQYIQIGFSTDLNTVGGFTVATWLKIDQAGVGYAGAVNKQFATANLNSWNLGLHDGFAICITGTDVLTGPAVPVGMWTHVACRWDGISIAVAVDGSVVKTQPATVPFDQQGMSIGADLDFGLPAVPFVGALDDVRVYNRAISDAELAALANP